MAAEDSDDDLDDALDDLLADIDTNEDEDKPTAPRKASLKGDIPLQTSSRSSLKTQRDVSSTIKKQDDDISDLFEDAGSEKKSKGYMDDLLGKTSPKSTVGQKSDGKKDPLSEIFEKGAWKKVIEDEAKDTEKAAGVATTVEAKSDAKSKASEQIGFGSYVPSTKTPSKRRTVRFTEDEPKISEPPPPKPSSKLDNWLFSDSADLDTAITETYISEPKADQKEILQPSLGSVPLVDSKQAEPIRRHPRDRNRGLQDLSFLSEPPSKIESADSKKESPKRRQIQKRNSVDWLGLNSEDRPASSGGATDTKPSLDDLFTGRPRTAPELTTTTTAPEIPIKSEPSNTPASDADGNFLSWLGKSSTPSSKSSKPVPEDPTVAVSKNVSNSRVISPKESSKDQRALEKEASLLSSTAKPEVNERSSSRVYSNPPNETCRIGELERQLEEVTQKLQGEISLLKEKVRLAEEEKSHLQRLMDKVTEQHKTEVNNIEVLYRKMLKDTEELMQQQHKRENTLADSTMKQLESRISILEDEKRELGLQNSKKLEQILVEHKEEINSLKEAHKLAISKIKLDYEEQITRLQRLKNQEMEAISGSFEQARGFQSLTDQLNDQTLDMKRLQRRFEEMVETGLGYRQNLLDSKDRQLQALESRLKQEQQEDKEELKRARNLISYLQNLNRQHSIQLEEEKWKLQQEIAYLKTIKRTQEEQKTMFEDQIQRQKDNIERMKDSLLREHHSLVSQLAQYTFTMSHTSFIREVSSEKLGDEVKSVQLEKKERELAELSTEMNRKSQEVEKLSMNAKDLWKHCQEKEAALKQFERMLQAREATLCQEKLKILELKRESEGKRKPEKVLGNVTYLHPESEISLSRGQVNPSFCIWKLEANKDQEYLNDQNAYLKNLHLNRS